MRMLLSTWLPIAYRFHAKRYPDVPSEQVVSNHEVGLPREIIIL